ncbi:MAG: GH25 family lysozyme [Lachnospiraceae bacterium]|nr:GH25 family lysozyme [Lachnospiraceae bacterium]
MSKVIADISHWKPVTSWSKAKANCYFLISKATEGTSFVDSTLKSFVSGCEKNKIPFWLYVYLKKGNELKQAEFFVKTVKPLIKNSKYFVGYIVDVETNNTATNAYKALQYIEKQGYKCMWYSMYTQYSKYKSVIAKRGKNTAYWEARYGANNGKDTSAKYPCHSTCELHQYTSVAKVGGLSGAIDLNKVMNRNCKDLKWFMTPLSQEKKKPISTTTSYYKKYTGTSSKIDTIFKAVGVPEKYRGSFGKRKAVAKKNGYSNYSGTAKQNLALIELAKKGKLKKV